MSFPRIGALLIATALAIPATAQDTPTLNARLTEALQREGNGHSPTDEEIAAASTVTPQPPAAEVHDALPALTKVLENADTPLRTLGLSLLTSLEAPPDAPAAQPGSQSGAQPGSQAGSQAGTDAPPIAPQPPVLKAETAAALAPEVPQIAARLTDDLPANRLLAAKVLGGFAGNAPGSLFPPLYAYLKREDAPGAVGTAIVQDLLLLAPLTPEAEAAIAKFIHRADQTADSRANLVDAIATSPNQSQSLNKSIVAFLGSDDASLRARVILSLPQLDLAPDVFAETHTRVAQLVDNSGENLQVINAAKAVATCWTAVKMTSGCPVY